MFEIEKLSSWKTSIVFLTKITCADSNNPKSGFRSANFFPSLSPHSLSLSLSIVNFSLNIQRSDGKRTRTNTKIEKLNSHKRTNKYAFFNILRTRERTFVVITNPMDFHVCIIKIVCIKSILIINCLAVRCMIQLFSIF